jgi:hypothetical protein
MGKHETIHAIPDGYVEPIDNSKDTGVYAYCIECEFEFDVRDYVGMEYSPLCPFCCGKMYY